VFLESSVTAAPGDTQGLAIEVASGLPSGGQDAGVGVVDTPRQGPPPKTAHYSQRIAMYGTTTPSDSSRTMPASPARYRSKTLAAWLAVLGGTLGLHSLYLKGPADALGWLHLVPTALGWAGVIRMRQFGQDDTAAWLLIPLLGLMIAWGMLCAILYGLTPDEKWDARHNPGLPGARTGWGPVLGVIAALMVGSAVLMGTVAFSIQKLFEWELDPARQGGAAASTSTRP